MSTRKPRRKFKKITKEILITCAYCSGQVDRVRNSDKFTCNRCSKQSKLDGELTTVDIKLNYFEPIVNFFEKKLEEDVKNE